MDHERGGRLTVRKVRMILSGLVLPRRQRLPFGQPMPVTVYVGVCRLYQQAFS